MLFIKLLLLGLLLTGAPPGQAASPPTLEERIVQCEHARRELRAQILSGPYFATINQGRSGDKTEALIYSVGNFLTYGTHRKNSNESKLQSEGRHLASSHQLNEADAESFKAYIKNRNLLNSLYLQRNQARAL